MLRSGWFVTSMAAMQGVKHECWRQATATAQMVSIEAAWECQIPVQPSRESMVWDVHASCYFSTGPSVPLDAYLDCVCLVAPLLLPVRPSRLTDVVYFMALQPCHSMNSTSWTTEPTSWTTEPRSMHSRFRRYVLADDTQQSSYPSLVSHPKS